MKDLTNDTLRSFIWDKVSSWEPRHIDEAFFSTATNITENEKAMLEELVKWKDNRVYESVDYNNQKLI